MNLGAGLVWSLLLLQGFVVCQNTPPSVAPGLPQYFTVLENATRGTPLFTLKAKDPDPNENLIFGIATTDTSKLVRLGTTVFNSSKEWSCDVILNASYLDRDREPAQRQLFFSVTDKNGLTTLFKILMFINDVNDNPPSFVDLPYRKSIREDFTVGSVVYKVSATDPDSGGGSVISFNITAVNANYNNTFQLESGGRIVLSKPLDYETLTFYHYNVTVKDEGDPPCPGDKCQCKGDNETCNPAPVDLFLTIIDVQDTPPIFDKLPYIGTVPENETVGFSILRVTAVDGDRGVAEPNLIHYSITKDSSPFVISEVDGIISVNATLDADLQAVRDQGGLYIFTVTATEVPPPGSSLTSNPMNTSSTEVSIKVTDVNDNPPRFTAKSYTAQVQENTPAGVPITVTTVIEVQDKDQDLNSRFWVYLEKDGATFNDFETLPKENTVIQGKSTITIIVVNSTVLDYETTKTITFKIIAKENNTNPNIKTSSEALVTLTIEDTNDNSPYFPNQPTTFSVSEDAPVGHIIGTVTAHDVDTGEYGKVVFDLEENGNGAFNISEKGIIQLAKQVDREMQQLYTLVVVASDNPAASEDQRRKSTLRIQVNVTDVNDNSPIWTQFIPYVNVLESSKVGMKVTDVRAVDKDEGINGQITYSIAPGTNGSGLFNITELNDSAEISIQESLIDHVGLLVVQVIAEDKGTPPNNATIYLSIFVIDENQNRPVFAEPDETMYNSSAGLIPEIAIYEEQPLENELYTLVATDKDIGQNGLVMYYLDPTINKDYEYFRVDRFNGTLKAERKLDRDVKEIYEIQVRAEDNGNPAPLSKTLIMKVRLLDIDDNEPTYISYTMPQVLQVLEEKSNACIGQILPAIDIDSYPNNVTCYYLYGDHLSGLHLNKQNRELSVIEKIDRETIDTLKIVIKASENCTVQSDFFSSASNISEVLDSTSAANMPPPAYNSSDESLLWVKVTVLDINDNPPRFKNHDLSTSAIFDVDIGTEVMSLANSITDKDTPPFSMNKFKLQAIIPHLEIGDSVDMSKEAFVVSLNGSISTNIRFRTDMVGYFLLQVLVYDDDGMNDTARIKVFLISTLDRLLLVFDRLPNQVQAIKDSFIKQLSDIVNLDLMIDKIQSNTNPDGTRDPSRTAMYIHGRYRDSGKVVPAADLRRLLDSSSAARSLLFGNGVTDTKTLDEKTMDDEADELKKIMAIAVSILAVIVVALFVVLVHMVRLYRHRLRAATTVAYTSPKEKEAMEHPGTNKYFSSENPLFGKNITPVDHDDDTTSHNSLDVNAVDEPIPSPTSTSAGQDEEQEIFMQIKDNNQLLSTKNAQHNSNLDFVLQAYDNTAFTKDDDEDVSGNNRSHDKRSLSSQKRDGSFGSRGMNLYEGEPDFYDEIYDSSVPDSHVYQSHVDYTDI